MTKLLRAGFASALCLSAAAAAAQTPPRDPSGTYLTEDGRARIRVEKCGAARENVCGYVVWLKPAAEGAAQATTDAKNPDRSKQARPLLGHQMFMGLTANDEGHYDGQVYSSDNGKLYDVTVWADRPDRLRVKGCLVRPLCMTQSWTRTADVLPGQLAAATGAAGGPTPDPEWASTSTAAAKPAPRRAAPASAPAPAPAPRS